MPLSDMLFSNTHNVEQLVDIKHKKSVDKVLLKVIKTVRDRASITNWVKPTSDLRKDFNVTDRQMKSICSVLSSYYNVSLDPDQINTPGDMIGLIKMHKARATDSLYLIDRGTMTNDEDDELEPKENLEVKPEIIETSEPSLPSDMPVPENSEPSIEGGKKKPIPIDAVKAIEKSSDESFFDAVLVGGGVVAVAVTITKLYKDRQWDKLVEYMSANYEKICADIRKNHKDDPAFKKNRAILYNVNVLKNAFAAREIQLKKLVSMPLPHVKDGLFDSDEKFDQYRAKLYAYFGPTKQSESHPVMEHRVKPGEPSYLTLEEAGYLNSMNVRALITKIKECFDLQDAFDQRMLPLLKRKEDMPNEKLPTIIHKNEGETFKALFDSMKITDHFHALYKEEWSEHFSTHVMKTIVNGLEGKPNDKIGSEQLKVEASTESLTPEQKDSEDWGSMMDSF